MVYNILMILGTCIAFNFLFIYVIDFNGKILKEAFNRKDAFDVFVGAIVIAPISTICYIILLVCHIALWIIDNVLLREDNFIEQENNKLPKILKEFNELLARN